MSDGQMIQAPRPAGREAAGRKYDILTALGAHGCAGDKHRQRLVLRLIVLITARYNWQHDELSVGQREIARLWAVDERTVKREMARLRALGWLVVKRAAVRGRVAVHGLDLGAILTASAADWAAVGPDFEDRMRARTGMPAAGAGQGPGQDAANVVAFPLPRLEVGDSEWGRALRRLHRDDAAVTAAWFVPLRRVAVADGVLELAAPTRFHATFVTTHHAARILAALRAADASLRAVRIV